MYNALGQRVRTVVPAVQAGTTVRVALSGLAAGVYLVKLTIGNQLSSRQLLVQ